MASPQLSAAAAMDGVAKAGQIVDWFAGYGWTFNFLIRDDGSESMEEMVVTRDYFRVTGLKNPCWVVPSSPLIWSCFAAGNHCRLRFLAAKGRTGNANIVGKTVRMSRREIHSDGRGWSA